MPLPKLPAVPPKFRSPLCSTAVTARLCRVMGIAFKLWSVNPNLFRWPPARSVKHVVERASVAVLVSKAYVLIGSVLLQIAVKLPDITCGFGVNTRASVTRALPHTFGNNVPAIGPSH